MLFVPFPPPLIYPPPLLIYPPQPSLIYPSLGPLPLSSIHPNPPSLFISKPKAAGNQANCLQQVIHAKKEKQVIQVKKENKNVFNETPEHYQAVTLRYIQHDLLGENRSTKWVHEILAGEREAERVVYEDPHPTRGFVILPKIAWEKKGFPMDRFYLHAFVYRQDIYTVRELTREHLPLLHNLRRKVYKFVRNKYGLEPSQYATFFHYMPTAFHLHLHIAAKRECDEGIRMLDLNEVIKNISKDSLFYKKATLQISSIHYDKTMNYLRNKRSDKKRVYQEKKQQKMQNAAAMVMQNATMSVVGSVAGDGPKLSNGQGDQQQMMMNMAAQMIGNMMAEGRQPKEEKKEGKRMTFAEQARKRM